MRRHTVMPLVSKRTRRSEGAKDREGNLEDGSTALHRIRLRESSPRRPFAFSPRLGSAKTKAAAPVWTPPPSIIAYELARLAVRAGAGAAAAGAGAAAGAAAGGRATAGGAAG